MQKKLSEEQKECLRKFVGFTCEQCHKTEDQVGTLEVHRIRRGNEGGLYELRNVKILCKGCHDKYHAYEEY